MLVIFATIGLEIGWRAFGKMLPNLDRFTILFYDHLLPTAFFSLIGLFLLYVGARKLSRF
jgi:uncharacterized membrane protein